MNARFLRGLVRIFAVVAVAFVVLGIATSQWTAAIGDTVILVILLATDAGLSWAIRQKP